MKTHIFPAALLIICSCYSGFSLPHGSRGAGHPHGGIRFGISGGRQMGGHSGFGFYFGVPYIYPHPYYNYPYYPPVYQYYPPVTIAPNSPPVYIQQTPPETQEYPPGYWYYCSNPQGYYPYIKECKTDWQQVEPAPPPPTSSSPTQP